MSQTTGTARPTPPAAAPPAPDEARLRLAATVAVAALAAAAYANTLGHGFVWDDPISLYRWLPALQTAAAIFFPPPNIPQFPSDYYRPLQLLSYQLDKAVGGGAAWPFHLSVVVLHVLTTALMFRAGLRLFGNTRAGWWAALWSAALFAVHPIHSESVAWMAARPDVMVACAGMAALLAYWHEAWSAWRRSLTAAALVLLALLCKENAAPLLLLIPASLPLLARAPAAEDATKSRAQRRRGVDTSQPHTSYAALLPFAAALVLYLLLRTAGLSRMPPTPLVIPAEPVAMFLAAAGTYLRLLLVPYPQSAYISDLAISPAALGLHLTLIGGFGLLLWWAWRRHDRVMLFALLWLALTLGPSLAVIIKLPTAPISERYLYLPSIGFCWALGALACRAYQRRPDRLLLVHVALAALVLLGLAMTVQRNRVWHDNYSLWSDTAAKNTIDALPLRSLAAATLDRGDAAEAERLFMEALKRRNNRVGQFTIYNNLGSIALNRDDFDKAEDYYRKAFALTPSVDCAYNLGLIAFRRASSPAVANDAAKRQALLKEALSMFQQAVAASPHDPEMQVALGQAAQALGDRPLARTHFEQALQLGLPASTSKAVQGFLDELR